MPPESEDNDSMAEYGEGEAGKYQLGQLLGRFFFPRIFVYGFLSFFWLPDQTNIIGSESGKLLIAHKGGNFCYSFDFDFFILDF